MKKIKDFKWKDYEPEIILWGVRWYCRYAISYRDLKEMMEERGLEISHTTLYRWAQQYAPEIDKRARPYLKQSNDSYRVDETYVKVKGQWKYLYRKAEGAIPKTCRFRQKKYLNNIIEQSHRFIKRLIQNNQWFSRFKTAKKTIAGYEIINMIRRGQIKFVGKGDVLAQKHFVESLFGIGA